jgi:crossover junction endodeoxyribonuclease RuvC
VAIIGYYAMIAPRLIRMTKSQNIRILGIDTSFSSPGMAVIEVKNGKAKLIAASHVKTDGKYAKLGHEARNAMIRSWTVLFCREHLPFDVVVREKFTSPSVDITRKVFGAWREMDSALATLGYTDTPETVTPSKWMKTVTGKGNPSKEEIETAVKRYLGDVEFATSGKGGTYDESDAAGLALWWAIENGLIKRKGSDVK